jgi:heat shock protein HslJ
MRIFIVGIIFLLSATLVACDKREHDMVSPLENTSWQLISLDGKPLLPETVIDLTFQKDSLGGHSGVNQYFASYKTGHEQSIELKEVGQTLMAALDPAVMDQEALYIQLLTQAKRYKLYDQKLEIITAEDKVLLFVILE